MMVLFYVILMLLKIYVQGFTTDGKFNSLRTKGKTCPISVVEIIMMVKREAKSINVNTLTNKFTMDERGTVCDALLSHKAPDPT